MAGIDHWWPSPSRRREPRNFKGNSWPLSSKARKRSKAREPRSAPSRNRSESHDASFRQPLSFTTRLIEAGCFFNICAGRMGRTVKFPPQFGQNSVQDVLRAVRAERAFISANPRITAFGRQIAVATLTIRAKFQHDGLHNGSIRIVPFKTMKSGLHRVRTVSRLVNR